MENGGGIGITGCGGTEQRGGRCRSDDSQTPTALALGVYLPDAVFEVVE
jgi:hypothetical protein